MMLSKKQTWMEKRRYFDPSKFKVRFNNQTRQIRRSLKNTIGKELYKLTLSFFLNLKFLMYFIYVLFYMIFV